MRKPKFPDLIAATYSQDDEPILLAHEGGAFEAMENEGPARPRWVATYKLARVRLVVLDVREVK